MKKNKLHIDELFRKGLRGLSLFVSGRDLEAIEGKKSVFNDAAEEHKKNLFSEFEMETGDDDWHATKAKLDAEKSVLSPDHSFRRILSELEPELPADAWPGTARKLMQAQRKRHMLHRMLGVLVFLLSLLIYDFSATENHRLAEKGPHLPSAALQTDSNRAAKRAAKLGSPILSEPTQADPAAASSILAESSRDISKSHSQSAPASGPQYPAMSGTAPLSVSGRANPAFAIQEAFRQTPAPAQVEWSPERPFNPLQAAPAAPQSALPAADSVQQIQLPEIPSADTPSAKKVPLLPVLNPARPYFYLGLVSQLAASHRVLDRDNPAFYRQVRNAAESPFMQWAAGIEFGLRTQKSQVSAAVQKTTQTWTSHYQYSYRIYDSIPVWNPGRTQILGYFLVRGRDTAIQEVSRVRIDKIQIPLEYARSFKLNSKFSMLAGAGLVFAWNIRSSGSSLLNPANMQLYPYAALRNQERVFSLSPSLTLGAERMLDHKFSLQLLAFGNTSLLSRFKTGFGAGDRPYSAGMTLKLIYRIP